MPIPWLRIIDALLGAGNFALARRLEQRSTDAHDLERRGLYSGSLEARMANVVVAALKEVFDRDSRRIEFEREQAEAERQRAERALRLELCRQAAERETARLRVLTGVTVVAAIGALYVSVQLIGHAIGSRVVLGAAWLVLLAALVATFAGQSAVGRAVASFDPDRDSALRTPGAASLAGWLAAVGLALVAAAVLVA
jgi:hypothetical protein